MVIPGVEVLCPKVCDGGLDLNAPRGVCKAVIVHLALSPFVVSWLGWGITFIGAVTENLKYGIRLPWRSGLGNCCPKGLAVLLVRLGSRWGLYDAQSFSPLTLELGSRSCVHRCVSETLTMPWHVVMQEKA